VIHSTQEVGKGRYRFNSIRKLALEGRLDPSIVLLFSRWGDWSGDLCWEKDLVSGVLFYRFFFCSSGPTVDCTLLVAKVGYRPDSFIKPGFSHGLVISILPLFGNTGPSAYQLIVIGMMIGISISWQQVSLLLRTN
jgi:hypothetical protein